MADALSRLADFYSQQRRPAGQLETSMELPGADIISIKPPVQPAATPATAQPLEASVIEAPAPEGPESKYKMLNRILGVMQSQADNLGPDPVQKQRLQDSISSLQASAQAPRKGLDIDSIQKRAEASQPRNEWTQDDYLKGALVALLPAIGGAIAGGFPGAVGGSKGGLAGIDLMNKLAADKEKSRSASVDKSVDNQIAAYRAETEARGKEIRTMADLVKLDVELNGKMSEPLKELIKATVPAYMRAEVDTYERELQEQGLTERKLMDPVRGDGQAWRAEDAKARRENDRTRFADDLDEKRRQFDNRLMSEEQRAKDTLESRERVAMAALKAREKSDAAKNKAAAAKAAKATAEKPPNSSQGAAAGFAQRAIEANKALEMYTKTSSFDATKPGNVFIDVLPKNLRGFVQDPDHQKFDNAWNEYAAAVLRDETGAAIAEFEQTDKGRAQKPMPGDSEEVLKQKARNRANQIQALAGKAGLTAMENARPPQRTKEDPRVRAAADAAGISYADARKIYMKKGYKLDETE